ncbi:MAG: hypothetical protein EBQ80_01720 [Proteobacteria bacterium]|nr:hypothetical protein [Pseudomonadota bacterium]
MTTFLIREASTQHTVPNDATIYEIVMVGLFGDLHVRVAADQAPTAKIYNFRPDSWEPTVDAEGWPVQDCSNLRGIHVSSWCGGDFCCPLVPDELADALENLRAAHLDEQLGQVVTWPVRPATNPEDADPARAVELYDPFEEDMNMGERDATLTIYQLRLKDGKVAITRRYENERPWGIKQMAFEHPSLYSEGMVKLKVHYWEHGKIQAIWAEPDVLDLVKTLTKGRKAA